MADSTDALRDHLVRVLDWEDAHVSYDKAVDGISPHHRGARAAARRGPQGARDLATQLILP